eukprot:365497-Chlamydomonas_euryale.AAC.6
MLPVSNTACLKETAQALIPFVIGRVRQQMRCRKVEQHGPLSRPLPPYTASGRQDRSRAPSGSVPC